MPVKIRELIIKADISARDDEPASEKKAGWPDSAVDKKRNMAQDFFRRDEKQKRER